MPSQFRALSVAREGAKCRQYNLSYLQVLDEDLVTESYDAAFATEDRATETFRQKATRGALLGVEWKE